MLLSRSQRHVQAPRLAAFAKRLGCSALHSEPGEALGALAVARDVCARNPRVRQLLENDADCSGSYDPDAAEPEAAGGLFAVAWELALLARHAHPAVAAAARELAGLPVEADAVVPPPKLNEAPRARPFLSRSCLPGARKENRECCVSARDREGVTSDESAPAPPLQDVAQRFSTLAGLFQPPPPAHPQRKGNNRAGGPAGSSALARAAAPAPPPQFAPFFREMRDHAENAGLRRELRGLARLKCARPRAGLPLHSCCLI